MKNQFRPVYIPCLALITAGMLLVQAFLFMIYVILYIVYHIYKDIQSWLELFWLVLTNVIFLTNPPPPPPPPLTYTLLC